MLRRWLALLLLCWSSAGVLGARRLRRAWIEQQRKRERGPHEGHCFSPSSMTIKPGESISLVKNTPVPPIIANGTWKGHSAQPARAPGAPEVTHLQIDGNRSETIGPFNTAGTFALYCTIHPDMNLTVVVE